MLVRNRIISSFFIRLTGQSTHTGLLTRRIRRSLGHERIQYDLSIKQQWTREDRCCSSIVRSKRISTRWDLRGDDNDQRTRRQYFSKSSRLTLPTCRQSSFYTGGAQHVQKEEKTSKFTSKRIAVCFSTVSSVIGWWIHVFVPRRSYNERRTVSSD